MNRTMLAVVDGDHIRLGSALSLSSMCAAEAKKRRLSAVLPCDMQRKAMLYNFTG